MKKHLLLAYLVLTLLAIFACGVHFAREIAATGIASGPLIAAVGLAGLALLLGSVATWRVGRAAPHELGFLGARYLRVVFSAKLIAFVIMLFGSHTEATARLAAHLLGAMALHRLALLWPARLSALLAAVGRHRALSAAELLVFNLGATLLLAEGALRAWYTSSGTAFFASQTENPMSRKLVAPLFGYDPNSLGYNDDEFSLEKRHGTRRIAVIGDSFLVAQVPRPQGVIARTEDLLAASDPRIEVYNFSIVASDIDDYRILLEDQALAFQPDFVLVGIYVGNDLRISTLSTAFHHDSYAIERALTDIRQRLVARQLERAGEFRDATRTPRGASAVDLETPIATRERYLESIRRELAFFSAPASSRVERAWYDSLAALEQIIALCRERGVPLAVVVSPSHPQVSRATLEEGALSAGIDPSSLDVALPQRRLDAFLAERGVPVLDLLARVPTRRARAQPR